MVGRATGTGFFRNRVQEAASVKHFDAGAPEASHAKREPLQSGVRISSLFEDQHGELREPELAGEEQADRAGPRDDDVVDPSFHPSSLPEYYTGSTFILYSV